jgi:hypothetical protein
MVSGCETRVLGGNNIKIFKYKVPKGGKEILRKEELWDWC